MRGRDRYLTLLLRLLPRGFRARHAEEIEASFEEMRSELGSAPTRFALLRLYAGVTADVIRQLPWAMRRAAPRGGTRRARAGRRGVLLEIQPSWLDLKLGARSLVRHWGLTLVSTLSMATAIAIGALFAVAVEAVRAPLPFEDGHRVVAIESWDMRVNNQERRILHDVRVWAEELTTVEHLGAYRSAARRLTRQGSTPEPMLIVEMSASGFNLSGVSPLMGRVFTEADELSNAPLVLVIGENVWRARFSADPSVLGQTVRIDGEVFTVVGVMPAGFGFPIRHDAWTPLRLGEFADYERGEGPPLWAFARLVEGIDLEAAQAELTAVGQRAARASAAPDERFTHRVMPYTAQLFDDAEGWELYALLVLVLLLLIVVCGNVAVLVYARLATRFFEIAMRSALGASRGRIIVQLFAEAVLLSSVAAAFGLGLAALVLQRANVALLLFGVVPFWMHLRISVGVVLFVAALVLLAALIVGVIPSVQATGRRVSAAISRMGSGVEMTLGRTWTLLVAGQVALSVAAVPTALLLTASYVRVGFAEPGFDAQKYLAVRVALDPEPPPDADGEAYASDFLRRSSELEAEFIRRMELEPSVTALTYATSLPSREPTVRVETEIAGAANGATVESRTRQVAVDVEFFETYGVGILTGRPFDGRDLEPEATAVLVNQAFADRLGAGVVGRRIRLKGGFREGGVTSTLGKELGQWYDIVGVVEDFPDLPTLPGEVQAKLYFPVGLGTPQPLILMLRTEALGADAANRTRFVTRVQEVAASLDTSLRVVLIAPLDMALGSEQTASRIGGFTLGAVALSVLLLTACAGHALTSFTVSQRTREIGIRASLGAGKPQILSAIFMRVLRQVAIGIGVGVPVGALVVIATPVLEAEGAWVTLLAVAVMMVFVGVAAAFKPARQCLAVSPSRALREP